MMDERRKTPRVGLVSEVQVQKVEPEAGETISWGADLSEGGIGLLTNGQLQIGEEIALRIAVPGSADPILAKGLVVWTKTTGPGLRVGVKFKEVEALASARILQLVTQALARLSATHTSQARQAATQPAEASATPTAETPLKPYRARWPLIPILLAVVALALLLKNRELQASVRQLKAQVTTLQALSR